MKRLTIGFVLIVLGVVGCGSTTSTTTPSTTTSPSSTPTPSTSTSEPSVSPTPSMTAPPLRPVSDPGHVTYSVTLTPAECTLRGDNPNNYLPDPNCTPGSFDPKITAAILCAPGYTTRNYRAPESETEHAKFDIVGPAYDTTASGELDHLVSLELGGSNDVTNFWVEPGPIPNPKDTVENALHAWVCSVSGSEAQTRLTQAQAAIASNWTTAEQVLGVS